MIKSYKYFDFTQKLVKLEMCDFCFEKLGMWNFHLKNLGMWNICFRKLGMWNFTNCVKPPP